MFLKNLHRVIVYTLFGFFSCLVAGHPAFASGQYVVQSAEIFEPRSIIMELWHSGVDDANFVGITARGEVPFQVTGIVEMPRFGREVFELEGKYLFRELEIHGYGIGLSGIVLYDSDSNRIEESSLIIPFTLEPIKGKTLLHTNIGATHIREDSDTELFWGVGVETVLFGPFEAVAEVFGNADDEPVAQAGLRLWLFDNQVSLDVSYYKEFESDGESGWIAGVGFEALRF